MIGDVKERSAKLMNSRYAKQLTRKLFFSITLGTLSVSSLFAASRPLQILWDKFANEGGTFSVKFSPDGGQLASGGAFIVQSGAQSLYAQNELWTARDGTLLV